MSDLCWYEICVWWMVDRPNSSTDQTRWIAQKPTLRDSNAGPNSMWYYVPRDEEKKVADIFVKKGPFLKLYTAYIKDFEHMTELLNESCKKNPAFAAVVKDFEVSFLSDTRNETKWSSLLPVLYWSVRENKTRFCDFIYFMAGKIFFWTVSFSRRASKEGFSLTSKEQKWLKPVQDSLFVNLLLWLPHPEVPKTGRYTWTVLVFKIRNKNKQHYSSTMYVQVNFHENHGELQIKEGTLPSFTVCPNASLHLPSLHVRSHLPLL